MAEIQKDTVGSREDTRPFLDMVGLFSSQAMMALGKVVNPVTKKAEKNLEAARLFIDILDMLERKTQGNLTPEEVKILRTTLTDLRLMFVEETQNPIVPATPAEPAAPAAEGDADSKIKFQKKYD